MPTVTAVTTYEFATDVQGWSGAAPSGYPSMAWAASGGYDGAAGYLRASPNGTPSPPDGECVWEIALTWEGLGAAPGVLVNSVTLDLYEQINAFANHSSVGPYELWDAAGTTRIGTFAARTSVGSTWVARAGATVTVPSLYGPSGTTVILRLAGRLDPADTLGFLGWDHVVVTLDTSQPVTGYTTGGPYTISASAYPVLLDSVTMTLSSGASVAGNAAPDVTGSVPNDDPQDSGLFVRSASAVQSSGATLTVSGGTLAGGSDDEYPLWGGCAVQSRGDDLTIGGGALTGGASALPQGRPAVDCFEPTALSVTGGTVTGGASSYATTGVGGAGLWLVTAGPLVLAISGGTFNGGTGAGGTGYSAGVTGVNNLQINGGTFPHGIALDLTGGGSLEVTGSGLSYSAGVLSGTIGGAPQSIPITDLSGLGVSVASGSSSTDLTLVSP
jgi:hypothetical protein